MQKVVQSSKLGDCINTEHENNIHRKFAKKQKNPMVLVRVSLKEQPIRILAMNEEKKTCRQHTLLRACAYEIRSNHYAFKSCSQNTLCKAYLRSIWVRIVRFYEGLYSKRAPRIDKHSKKRVSNGLRYCVFVWIVCQSFSLVWHSFIRIDNMLNIHNAAMHLLDAQNIRFFFLSLTSQLSTICFVYVQTLEMCSLCVQFWYFSALNRLFARSLFSYFIAMKCMLLIYLYRL